MIVATLLFAAVYLISGVNFSLLLSAVHLIPDPRNSASGNPGVSNVYRTAGPVWASLVLLLDVIRAVTIAILCARLLPTYLAPWGALALVLGNLFPAFHRFRGGKGVANFLGFTVGLDPLLGLAVTVTWPLTFAVIRRTYLCSFIMVAALGVTLAHRFSFHPSALLAVGTTGAMIVWAHRSNIRSHRQNDSTT
jgi:acyl phosphate:glycerol-3-phosphate acyltransferase